MFQVKKFRVIFFAVLLALQAVAGSAAASTLYVDDDGTGNYTTIQSALKDAVSGDTIIVKPGTYPGNIELTVERLTIASESSSQEDTIIQVSSGSAAFNLRPGSSSTIIKGFTVKGSKSGYGINFDSASSCTIENNKLSNLSSGVSISLWTGGNQSILNNEFSECDTGIVIFESMDNKLKGNKISNCDTGVHVISDALGNVITDNNISNCSTGLWLDDSSGNEIYNNYFSNKVNLKLTESDKCIWNTTRTEEQNIIGGPYTGGNYWATPAGDGFSQAHPDTNGDGIAEETYKIDQQNADYLPLVIPGKQPVNNTSSNQSTNNTSSNQSANNTLPSESANNNLSNNTSSKTSGSSSNTSTVTASLSNNTSSKANPSNNTSGSFNGTSAPSSNTPTNAVNQETPTSVNSENNESTVENNSTSNENVQSGEDKQSTGSNISESNSGSSGASGGSNGSSGGGSKSGSGGGAGGSPESARNVEVKELAQAFISSGNEVMFNFPKNATCVVYVNFDAKKTLGKITTIAEMLKGKSALVAELPSGEVYKFFNVWVGNEGTASSRNIENPALCFRVEKSWLEDKSIDPASIALNLYSEKKWEQFPANTSGEDDKFLYFTANVSGYSSFAITGSKTSSISGKANSYLEQQGTSEQENSLPGNQSSKLTSEANDSVISGENEKSTPGFELVFGIASLFGVFLYRRSR